MNSYDETSKEAERKKRMYVIAGAVVAFLIVIFIFGYSTSWKFGFAPNSGTAKPGDNSNMPTSESPAKATNVNGTAPNLPVNNQAAMETQTKADNTQSSATTPTPSNITGAAQSTKV